MRLDAADKLSEEDREAIVEIARKALAPLPTQAGIQTLSQGRVQV